MMNDIQKVLSSYKQRFISTSSRSRSYFLTRLIRKHTLDLVKFNKDFGDNDNIKNQLENSQELKFKKTSINKHEIKKLLLNKDFKSIHDILPFFTNEDKQTISKLITNIDDIKNSLEANVDEDETDLSDEKIKQKESMDYELEQYKSQLNSEIIAIIEKNIKKMNKDFLSIDKLIKENNKLMRDFGKNDLYLGYPFIEGRFQSGKYFRAPLVLHKINISLTKNTVKIKIEEDESMINPVFLIAYHLENELDHKQFDWSINGNNYLDEAKKILKSFDIKYSEPKREIEQFKSCTKKDFFEENIFDYNEFNIKNNIVLGLFPISDKNIFNDLETLENSVFHEEDSIATFINGNDNLNHLFEEEKEERALENEIKYITELDFSQKNVVKEALENNLVIEGPPGTGKSQVLSNIVANYVNQGKKVLVVSEKVAALEVIYNRLGKLSNNALLIRNHISDKTNFYKQLTNAINALSNGVNLDTYKSFIEMDNVLEESFRKLESRDQIYHADYKGFSFEEIIKANAYDVDSINNTVRMINKETVDLENRKEYFSEFTDKLKIIYDSKIFKNIYKLTENIKIHKHFTVEHYESYLKYFLQGSDLSKGEKKLFFFALINNISLSSEIEIKDNNSAKNIPFDELKSTIENLYETGTVETYEKHLEEINNPVYKNLGYSDSIVSLIKRWNNLTVKQKVVEIKRIFDETYKKPLFFFNPLKKLHTNERLVFDQLNDNIEDLNPNVIINSHLDENIKHLLQHLIKYNDYDNDTQTLKAFIKGIYALDSSDYKDLLTKLDNVKDVLDMVTLKELVNRDDALLKLTINLSLDEIEEKDKAYKAVHQHLTQDLYETIQKDIEFFKNYESKYDELIELQNNKMYKSRVHIENSVSKAIKEKGTSNIDFAKSINELRRISALKRKRSIAATTKKFTEAILNLFPICLMTPASVSATLENKKELFDVLVFDEASQMFVEHATPSIHRSKSIIVAGDSQQLRPSSIFSQRFTEGDEIDDEDASYDVTAALEEESLLDYCKNKYKSVNLRYHYRSDHKELIDFSSRAFYDSKLVFSSNVQNNEKLPIETIEVAGEWVEQKNESEAMRVAELVKQILDNRNNNETIGVITFNSKQMELIQDILDEEALSNDDLLRELEREDIETGSDKSLFVKNIENVQGDERDIIIFSVGYAKNQNGRFLNQFGSLSMPAGENRLNVAITRAKKKVYLVKSIEANIMRPNEENRGNFYFKKYLQYAEKLNNNEAIDTFLNELSDVKNKANETNNFDSPFEIEVYEALNSHLNDERYELRNQVKVGSFSIDLAVYDKKESNYILGIECDGAMYHSSEDAVEHDFYRQNYLESRGWVIHRIWSTNWWNAPKTEISKIINHIDSMHIH